MKGIKNITVPEITSENVNFKYLAKLIGFKYSLLSNLGEKVKTQTKDTGDLLKEEKRESHKHQKIPDGLAAIPFTLL